MIKRKTPINSISIASLILIITMVFKKRLRSDPMRAQHVRWRSQLLGCYSRRYDRLNVIYYGKGTIGKTG